jgi:hypothetical protein
MDEMIVVEWNSRIGAQEIVDGRRRMRCVDSVDYSCVSAVEVRDDGPRNSTRPIIYGLAAGYLGCANSSAGWLDRRVVI